MKTISKTNKRLIKIIIAIICIIFLSKGYMNRANNTLILGVNDIRVYKKDVDINKEDIKIKISKPTITYKDKGIQSYINSYIDNEMDKYTKIDYIRENSELINNINIDYDIKYKDNTVLNIVIFVKKQIDNEQKELYEYSYIFDLQTGQRVYINKFLDSNKNYDEIIENYIINELMSEKKYHGSDIKIDKNTNYYIVDDGICIIFNDIGDKNRIEKFKIPHDIFSKPIKNIKTKELGINISTKDISRENKYIENNIKIPYINENDDRLKMIFKCIEDNINKKYDEYNLEIQSYIKDDINIEDNYKFNVSYDIKKNTENIVSILVQIYTFSGGAHGYYENYSYNIDMKSKEIFNLKDIFNEKYKYKDVINNNINEQIKLLEKNNKYNKGVYNFNGISLDQKFYIYEDELVVYFDLYDIGPYALGIPEFNIAYEDISHIIRDRYKGIFK